MPHRGPTTGLMGCVWLVLCVFCAKGRHPTQADHVGESISHTGRSCTSSVIDKFAFCVGATISKGNDFCGNNDDDDDDFVNTTTSEARNHTRRISITG